MVEPSQLREPGQTPELQSLISVYGLYRRLCATGLFHTIHGLGGRLVLFCGLDQQQLPLPAAANIAGAASLAALTTMLQRSSLHSGIADFAVNSLSEALRILKNEVRRQRPVHVTVGVPEQEMLQEMLTRGVAPDCIVLAGPERAAPFLTLAPARIHLVHAAQPFESEEQLLAWHAPAFSDASLLRMETIVQELLPHDANIRRRWLRLAPRYLGRSARSWRVLSLSVEEARAFAFAVNQQKQSGELDAQADLLFL